MYALQTTESNRMHILEKNSYYQLKYKIWHRLASVVTFGEGVLVSTALQLSPAARKNLSYGLEGGSLNEFSDSLDIESDLFTCSLTGFCSSSV